MPNSKGSKTNPLVLCEPIPDGISAPLLNYGADSLTDAFPSLLNSALCEHSILDYWTPVSIVAIPNSSSLNIPLTHFRLTAFRTCGIKLTKRALLSHPTSSVSLPGNHWRIDQDVSSKNPLENFEYLFFATRLIRVWWGTYPLILYAKDHAKIYYNQTQYNTMSVSQKLCSLEG